MFAMNRIDDCLSTRNGQLFVDECSTLSLVKDFGSPIFVLSEQQLRRNVKRFQEAFQQGWPDGPVKVMPAAKANWIFAVQRILAQEGCGCDVYSPGELSIALRAGFDRQFISVNGVPKDPDHVRRCIKEGVRITVDSMEEVDMIEQASNDLSQTARIRLRLKPPLSNVIDNSEFVSEGLVPADIAAIGYKGGLTFEQITAIGPRLAAMKNVEIVGFHQHHGRHKPGTWYWREQMKSYAAEMGRVSKALGGIQPREIDIGGGFAIPRDPFNAATHYSEPLQFAFLHIISKGLKLIGDAARYKVLGFIIDNIVMHPNQVAAPSIEQYAEVCTRTLREELPKNGIETKGVVLELEPGRSLHGNAGIHLTTVKALKRTVKPIRFAVVIVDTTEFWFTGGRYEHHLHDYIFANKTNAEMVDKADVIGRSCFGDRLLPTVPIPDVKIGDLLAFLDTGAYQEVSMSNFNAMPRPGTVLVDGDRACVIRRAETEEDVFDRDIVPDYLK